MPLGEVFLSALLSLLFDRLVSSELLELAFPEGLPEKPNKWQKTLSVIKTVLDDAEEKQHDDAGIKKWLDDLRDLAFDLEDIVNEFDTKALCRKLVSENQASSSTKAWNPISALFTCLTPYSSTLRLKIAEITERFDNIAALKDQLDLKGKVDGSSNRRRSGPEPPTSVVNEAGVFGRETDVEAVLQLLPTEVHKPAELTVIPIQGMGGVGKTTLAQLVYNYEKVEKFFELKAWACVSEDFDVAKVTKTILESHTSQNCDGKDLNWLQKNLKGKLQGKRFLVVLDDLWNENYDKWTVFLTPFQAGAPGSTIIITARSRTVSSMVCSKNIAYHLYPLPNESCLSILIRHALGAIDFGARPYLQTVGEEIARKCRGSPLAAKILGGLLRNAQDHNEWEEVLKSNIWDSSVIASGIVPALLLSYHYLPQELKRCFDYCSIFPKDYEFEKDQVVLLWMAEGLLQHSENKSMEEVGGVYFHDLLSRSLFQHSSGNKSTFVMHGLVHDLATYVAGKFSFLLEGDSFPTNVVSLRHFSYLCRRSQNFEKFKVLYKAKRLRSFLPINLSQQSNSLAKEVLNDLLPMLSCLRVLSLSHYDNVTNLPKSIGKMKHLRYLNLSFSAVRRLPDSLCKLINLQTLELLACQSLGTLPTDMWKLINLRYLNITQTGIKEMPIQMDELKCLQTLPTFIIGKNNGSGLRELGKLVNLHGKLSILELQNVELPEDDLDASLEDIKRLQELVLEWDASDANVSENHIIVLTCLRPHWNLESLTIKYYGGKTFPIWVGNPSFNITFLHLYKCKYCSQLPPLGQLPLLRELCIVGFDGVVSVGPEFYLVDSPSSIKPFSKLRILKFEHMLNWEKWIPLGAENEGEDFPNLQQLYIDNCPKLELQVLSVRDCSSSISPSWNGLLSSLKTIAITFCEKLDLPMYHKKYESLERLLLTYSCDSLQAIPLAFFPNLYEVKICGCRNLEYLTISEQCQLKSLEISDCPYFVSFPKGGLDAPSLTSLCIINCGSLRSLPDEMHILLPSLEELRIEECPGVERVPKDLPANLYSISINGCNNLIACWKGTKISELPPSVRYLATSSKSEYMQSWQPQLSKFPSRKSYDKKRL